jgi:2-iminoacetate synthase ThiH
MTLKEDDGNKVLEKSLKVDALTIRKFRRKLDEMDRDYEKEEHEEELMGFFDQIIVGVSVTIHVFVHIYVSCVCLVCNLLRCYTVLYYIH